MVTSAAIHEALIHYSDLAQVMKTALPRYAVVVMQAAASAEEALKVHPVSSPMLAKACRLA